MANDHAGRGLQPKRTVAELKEHLARTLPSHMVPAAFVFLEALPLTSSGKVDRKLLPAPERLGSQGLYEAPRTASEELVAQIFAEVLKLDRVGREDDFFELGGHSLLAVKVVERMRRAGLNADVRTLFVTPTVAALAAEADHEKSLVQERLDLSSQGSEATSAENAKSLAFDQALPEMNHIEIVGWQALRDLHPRFAAVFLRDEGEHPRVSRRMEITRELVSAEGAETHVVRSTDPELGTSRSASRVRSAGSTSDTSA